MMIFTGLAQGNIPSYVTVLESAGFIERRVPVTAGPRSRQSRYHIIDPYLRFYYRFLSMRQSQLALGVQEPALAAIKKHMLDFIDIYTWEEICREWVLRAGAVGVLPYLADQVGIKQHKLMSSGSIAWKRYSFGVNVNGHPRR